jgi:hypothetical protein
MGYLIAPTLSVDYQMGQYQTVYIKPNGQGKRQGKKRAAST